MVVSVACSCLLVNELTDSRKQIWLAIYIEVNPKKFGFVKNSSEI